MYPILFSWGPIVVPSWHAFYVLGAIAAFYFLTYLHRRVGGLVEERHLVNAFICAYVCGYFGARVGSALAEEHKSGIELLLSALSFGPMMAYGGALGGTLGATGYIWAKKLPWRYFLDLGIPAFLLALGIGRIGCFLNGDDYGAAVPKESVDAWWAVTFPNLGDDVARYPVQLVEAAFTVALSGALTSLLLRRKLLAGIVGFVGIVGYGVFRFFIEFYRDDYRGNMMLGWVSPAQMISFVLIAVSAIGLLRSRREASTNME